MPEVNPEILRWARETAALSLDVAAAKVNLRSARGVSGPDRLAALESGEGIPSRPLLVRMAKQYRRPLVTFYLSRSPRRGDRGQDFGTLPEHHADADDAVLDALIRGVLARQAMVRAVLVDEDEATPVPFVHSRNMSDGVQEVLRSMEELLPGILADFRACGSPDAAFAVLRNAVESAGVFVLLMGNLGSYHSNIDVETFRGFALADEIAPFIVINDQDSRAAWSFTLLHELAHLCLGQTGVSGGSVERRVEVFCNDVAGEFLLPEKEVQQLSISGGMGLSGVRDLIAGYAAARNLSGSMVAYRLFRSRKIDRSTCSRLIARNRVMWHRHRDRQREKNQEREGGPNFYVVRGHRVGTALISLVGRMLGAGALPTAKAAKVLGVTAKQVQALLDTVGPGPSIRSA